VADYAGWISSGSGLPAVPAVSGLRGVRPRARTTTTAAGMTIATTTRRSASVSLAPCSTSDRLPQDGAPQADNQWALPAQRTRSRDGQGRNLHPGTIGGLELKIPILVPGQVVTNDILAFMGTGEHESVDSCDPSDLKLSLSRVPRWARTGAAQGASCETPIDAHTRGVSVQLEHLKLFAVAVAEATRFQPAADLLGAVELDVIDWTGGLCAIAGKRKNLRGR
jgi:hypothetical protein